MNDIQTSREAEFSVLGTLLVEPFGFSRVYSIVKTEDFFFPETRKVYSSMQSLFAKNIEINVQTVINYFKVEGYTGLTESELREFLDYRVSIETAVSFAAQIAEFSGWRSLRFGLENISKSVNNYSVTLSEASEKLSSLVSTITSKGLKDDIVHGAGMMEEFMRMLNRPKNMYTFSGIPGIDEHIFDFNPKELSIVAARPGVGKTTFMLQSALHNVLRGNRVGFLSMEMERPKLLNRLISHEASRNSYKISGTKISRMNPEEFMGDLRLVSTLEKITGLPLFIDDTGPWTSETVPQKIRKLYYEYQCNVIYVDYIGLIMGAGALGSAPKNQQLTAISAGLKGLASELSIPILAASQLNRDVERRADNRPFLADLRDSGSLEQDASIVAFLYPNVSREAHPDSNPTLFESITELPVTFEIAKQRNGPVNSFDLMLYKKYGIFMSKDDVNATY
jgi:replicative DNA helicase